MLVWGIQIKTFISENQVKVMTHMKIKKIVTKVQKKFPASKVGLMVVC